MYSWICEDLDNLEIYAAERVENPDWASYDIMYSMTDRAYSCDIIGHFYSDMAAAKTAGTAYDSGIIRVARIFANNTLQNLYMQVSITMDTAGVITILLGYGNGSGWDYVYSTTTVTWAEFGTWGSVDKEFNFLYMRDRHPLTKEGMPNYTGAIYLVMIMGKVEKYTGRWLDPQSPGRPYGRMDYTLANTGSLTDIPGGAFPCASDDAESRSQQSELVARLVNGQQGKLSLIYRTESDTHFCGVDGNYNPNPDDPRTKDPNEDDPEGPSRPGGGDGNHSRKTEAVGLPDLPALGALDAGMITLYRLTGPEMSSFSSELWTFWSAVKAFFADPLDFVVGCMILPFTPNSTRQARPKFGGDTWNTAFDVISEQFYAISCGTIDIEKYYGSCFDYDPYHKLEIYIPYVGYRELPVDQIMGKTIELTYHIDCMTGDFVAFVHTPVVGPTGPQLAQIICQFAGTMGVHVPLSRESFDAMVSAGINLLGGAVGMAAGGIAQAAGLEGGDLKANQIASQASAATVSAVNAGKRNVIRSGSIGASSGMLAKQNPFIISTLPRQSLPENYKDLEGYPSNIYGTVGSFPGYLAVETIKLEVSATNTEREMILSMLKGGIFV